MGIAIIHISDIHMSGAFYPFLGSWGQGPANSNKIPPGILGMFQGAAGHDSMAGRELMNSIEKIVRHPNIRDRKIILSITGDLTALGSDSDFVTAINYIHGDILTGFTYTKQGHPIPDEVGLGGLFSSTNRQILKIPGNHDHWGNVGILGSFYNQANNSIYETYFRPTQGQSNWWWHQIIKLNDNDQENPELEIMGIDTCSGDPQFIARGGVDQSLLLELESEIKQKSRDDEKRLKVMMLHHSPGYRNGTILRLDSQSRDLLNDFCNDNKIAILLTGHIHEIFIENTGVGLPKDDGVGQDTLEIRCGSTLQGTATNNKSLSQTFFVHLLDHGVSGFSWKTHVYERHNGSGPFIQWRTSPSGAAHHPFQVI